MAEKKWYVSKVCYCEHVKHEIALETQVVLSLEAHFMSLAQICLCIDSRAATFSCDSCGGDHQEVDVTRLGIEVAAGEGAVVVHADEFILEYVLHFCAGDPGSH